MNFFVLYSTCLFFSFYFTGVFVALNEKSSLRKSLLFVSWPLYVKKDFYRDYTILNISYFIVLILICNLLTYLGLSLLATIYAICISAVFSMISGMVIYSFAFPVRLIIYLILQAFKFKVVFFDPQKDNAVDQIKYKKTFINLLPIIIFAVAFFALARLIDGNHSQVKLEENPTKIIVKSGMAEYEYNDDLYA